ncbi:MAG: hypothetical protein JRJ75_16865 [Deltaproteobacteria bacterium]|nr:hypothetical protein [Deltaproteobacteria bacterium]
MFDTTIEITPEMLGLPREKKEEAEEKEKEDRPIGDEKTRQIIRKKLGLENERKGLRIKRREDRKKGETGEKKEERKEGKRVEKRKEK